MLGHAYLHIESFFKRSISIFYLRDDWSIDL